MPGAEFDLACTCDNPRCFLTVMPGLGFDQEQMLLVVALMEQTFHAGFVAGSVASTGVTGAVSAVLLGAIHLPDIPPQVVQHALNNVLALRQQPASPDVLAAMRQGHA